MTKEDKLLILKKDLQMLTSSNDEFLLSLLDAASSAVQREGINIEEGGADVDMAVIQYAAYLFRKRAGSETSMPRFLRWSLNNILVSQKGKSK